MRLNNNSQNVFKLNLIRSFVRLGEHNISTEIESAHIDVKVNRSKIHEKYDGLIHDIAIVFLVHDVTFTGEFKIIIWCYRGNESSTKSKLKYRLGFPIEFFRSN